MDCSRRFLYQILTSEKLLIYFSKSKLLNKSLFNYGLMRPAAKKTLVVICGVMFTEHCNYTFRTEGIGCIGNESLD